ncbi:DUF2946 domain-containing protein [Comamonas testosteroni]|uniref:DUF2946 domain-containing protein n=1 Tax=Comamonas testosteroni TaxID=285 RepID=A0A373FAQ2_COMTE|nr:DUF2946 domain-containing protein [Comamonas testosteroni]
MRAVLAAWLGVLLASGIAPWARAASPGWEMVCSATGSTQWAPSPFGDADQAMPEHQLDCALCLPMLAPPPTSLLNQPARVTAPRQTQYFQTAARVFASTLPPVRAPPL